VDLRLDRDSPVPLYHQLAEAIRWRISTGELAPGERLPALRAAAANLGVNLHTVRAAYDALAADGLLVSDGARGTRVVGRPEPAGSDALDAEVSRFVAEARRRFGVCAGELSRRVAAVGGGDLEPPPVSVVECSLAQCRDHAAELGRRLGIAASPWPLDLDGEPPAGPVVATYFHYAEIVRRWPHRAADLLFVAVRPDPGLVATIEGRGGDAGRVLACELDEVRAANLAADLRPLLVGVGLRVEPLAAAVPSAALEGAGDMAVCFAPRSWAELDEDARRDPRAVRVRYVIEDGSWTDLARRLAPGRVR